MLQISARRLSAIVLKLVNNIRYKKGSIVPVLVALWGLFVFSACHLSTHSDEGDRLNEQSYAHHYRSLDSVKVYADSVLNDPRCSNDNRAEALNNLAFYHIAKMDYSIADSLLREVYEMSDNHIELMIASVQQMRISQRRSDNKNFFEHRQLALQHRSRIYEEHKGTSIHSVDTTSTNSLNSILHGGQPSMTSHQIQRMHYAESEFQIVSSAYYYYIGLIPEASAAVDAIDKNIVMREDTAQYLSYLYNIGSGGILTHGSQAEIAQQEFDILMECYLLAMQYNYPFWQANALQAISEHLSPESQRIRLMDANIPAIRYLNTDEVADSLLAGNLAERALKLFTDYDDVYQVAAGWRSLSDCYVGIADYSGAIYCLEKALTVTDKINVAPSLLSSIHEKLSIAYSALDDKPSSDRHRNAYLDIQEETRQDRQLEARAEQLSSSLRTMRIMIVSIIVLIFMLIAVLTVLLLRRRINKRKGESSGNAALQKYRQNYEQSIQELEDEEEEISEHIAMSELNLSRQRESYEEHRAKMSLIDSLTPLIDRMLHEIDCLKNRDEDEQLRNERMAYINELTAQINLTNDFLTDWIRLKQGEISMKIETFSIDEIFDLVAKGSATFRKQGITLEATSNHLLAKADRTLTLFMVNTLCDNARKFTPKGGTVSLLATETEDEQIEISVTDTGEGMSQEAVDTLFDAKKINDETLLSTNNSTESKSHGFGLLNCKGIIEKYRKTSPLFSHVCIKAESTLGSGTRIAFRIPKGIKRAMLLISCLLSLSSYAAQQGSGTSGAKTSGVDTPGALADTPSALADSMYNCNIHGNYRCAMDYAKQCLEAINRQYHSANPSAKDSMYLDDKISATPTEVRWYRDGVNVPYNVILTLRNEAAVAALALHEFDIYDYNNRAGQQLFREMSVDTTLAGYCEQMQRTESNNAIAIMLLVILVLSFVPIYYFMYYRHVITDTQKAIDHMDKDVEKRRHAVQLRREEEQSLNYEVDRLHVANNIMANSLSTIKHETMYFPSRIQQMTRSGETPEDIGEVAQYYRSLYAILSRQARHNCRQQLQPDVLYDILLQKLARLAGIRKSELQADEETDQLQTYKLHIAKPDAPTLRIVTQIVRDLGELYGLRRCGIITHGDDITVTIPSRKHTS